MGANPIFGDLKCWVEEWDANGNRVETLAQCVNISVGRGAFLAAVEQRPAAFITLREWARVVEKSPAQIELENRPKKRR